MARTAIAVQSVARNAAVAVTMNSGDNVNGMYFPNTGIEEVILSNPTGGTVTVTFVSVADEAGRTGDVVRAMLTLEQGFAGKFKPAWFNQTDGTVQVNFSATGTKIAVVSPPQ
jgi:hypothetical protein